ncbi:hypothetical protein WMY93_011963 [Mugilogobius chulae]|uniref:RIB43A-like with coiled-coils protein 1 n=1 Tax=Mugilogobius chulae TaxID=88201 RepID=A0AAW0P7J6_9GOBI
MYKVDLPVDQSSQNAVERRRAAESARKDRIFNTRLRVMGLDLQALGQQQDEVLVQQDNNEKQKRTDLQSDLTKFWSTHQRLEDSHSADLNSHLMGASTLSVPESELGPASMQIFEGENQGVEDRKKEQMKITERNLRTQKEDNERRRMAEKHRGADVCGPPESGDECTRGGVQKSVLCGLGQLNHALAAEQAERKREERRQEERENLAEMWHTVTSDMMTENAEAAEQPGGGRPPRVLTDRWKGMSPSQLNAIHKEREAQCEEKQKQQDKERSLNTSFGLLLLKSSQAAEEEEQREAQLRRDRRMAMDAHNRLLAKEQQTHQEYLDKILYTNKPTKDYFRQFNTSSR